MDRLVRIMARLRAPDGCPWDREQTPESLKKYVIEEAYEVCDAIDSGTPEALREELGDLLLQVVFQAQIAQERGWFDASDVVTGISDKMEHRHPHVFGSETAATADDVARQWEARKAIEKAGRGPFDGIPKALPALSKATAVLNRVGHLGRPAPGDGDPLAAAAALIVLLQTAPQPETGGDSDASEDGERFGQLLLVLAEAARGLRIDPSSALDRATRDLITAQTRHSSGVR